MDRGRDRAMDKALEKALNKNIQTIYCMTFFQAAMVVSAVFVPLLQNHGLTMSQVLQTQAVFALVVAAFEVPSGYLADIWGRKRAILVGQGLMAVAYGWFVFADGFVDFMIYEAVMGVGISLCSGADLALLYDTQSALKTSGSKPSISGTNHISRLVAIESYSGAVAAIFASVLTMVALAWVPMVQFGVAAVAFGFACQLIEVDRQLNLGSHTDNFSKVFTFVTRKPLVLWTGIAIMVCGLASLLGFWLIQKYWESQNIPVYLFGYIWAVHGIVRGVSANLAGSIEKWLGWRKVLIVVGVLPIIGFCGLGFLGGWLGVLVGLLLPISRGLNMVVFYDALNRRVSATFRATINSLVSLGTRTLFIFAGPLLGYLVDIKGVNMGFLVLAAAFIPVYLLVLWALSRSILRESMLEPPALKTSAL